MLGGSGDRSDEPTPVSSTSEASVIVGWADSDDRAGVGAAGRTREISQKLVSEPVRQLRKGREGNRKQSHSSSWGGDSWGGGSTKMNEMGLGISLNSLGGTRSFLCSLLSW